MANIYGRQVVIPLTNKSGGGVIAGDVVIIDTTNNDAFTTTTSAAYVDGVGIAQETIANNATGRVLTEGYAALVNVNASVTRGHYGTTFTVAKQATDFGASRGVGTFCKFLTGGTTPDALVWPVDLLGSSLTNPMTAVGDIIQGTTAGAPAKLVAPLAGKVLTGAGVTTPLVYAYPPGYEFDYVQKTTDTNITATAEGSADTIVTGNAITYDGSTAIIIEFRGIIQSAAASGVTITAWLYDGSSSIGAIGQVLVPGVLSATITAMKFDMTARCRITPTAATKTYSIRCTTSSGTSIIKAGAGGSGVLYPTYIRQVKV